MKYRIRITRYPWYASWWKRWDAEIWVEVEGVWIKKDMASGGLSTKTEALAEAVKFIESNSFVKHYCWDDPEFDAEMERPESLNAECVRWPR